MLLKNNRTGISDDIIIAPADGIMIPLSMVKDDVFSKKMMGDGIAFEFEDSTVTLCAPANGKLTVLFPTGHAYGITMNNGTELLVHIGIDTVEANGNGFKKLKFRQGDMVKAEDPIVTVDVKHLRKTYDMTTMMIITDANGNEYNTVHDNAHIKVKCGDTVITKK
jgi:PTS system glucose-specific IIA component